MGIRGMALLLTVGSWASAAPAAYQIQPVEGSRFALEVHKTGLMSGKTHLFLFGRYRGELTYDAEKPEASEIRLTIESASAKCQDTWVKKKQLTDIEEYAAELLAVKEHPEMTFTSRSIEQRPDGRFAVHGDLTIRGLAKPVTVTAELTEKGDGLEITGSAVVNLKDYGIKPKRAALGMIGTKDEMDVSFELTATPR